MPAIGVKNMQNEEVVKDPLTQGQESESIEELTPEEEGVEPTQAKAGDKTEPNLLLKSLHEEREKRRELEELLKQKESSTSSDDEVFSDEGKALDRKFNERTKQLESELAEIKKENAKKEVLIANPDINEHQAEFEEYLLDPENQGMSLQTAAKAFKVEKGLLTPKRTGLESPTGGDKTPSTVGKMTSADAKLLRETNFRKYQDMIMKDQIQIVD